MIDHNHNLLNLIKPYNNNHISCVIYLYTIIIIVLYRAIVLKDIPSIQFFKNDLYIISAIMTTMQRGNNNIQHLLHNHLHLLTRPSIRLDFSTWMNPHPNERPLTFGTVIRNGMTVRSNGILCHNGFTRITIIEGDKFEKNANLSRLKAIKESNMYVRYFLFYNLW